MPSVSSCALALTSCTVLSMAGFLPTSTSVESEYSTHLLAHRSVTPDLSGPPPPGANQNPSQLSGCIAKSDGNAAFNIYVRASNYSLPWPHKDFTFTFGGLGGNIIQLYNDTTQQSTDKYLGLPQNYSIGRGDYSTQLSLYSLLNGTATLGPQQLWWLCAPPDGPEDPDWQAWFWLGQQMTFQYCRLNGQIYLSAPPHVENFVKKYMCDPIELLISHNPQNVYNGHMSNSTKPVGAKRQIPSGQALQGSPKAPVGDFSNPRCSETQTSPFRLVELPVNSDPRSERGPLDWDAAFLPAGEALWTLQNGSLATVEQGAGNLRLVVNQQDRQVQTTGNANWANIEWNIGWSLCGDLQQLAIGGSTIFADCDGEVRYNNVTRSDDGSIINQKGIDSNCDKVVILAVPAGDFPNLNTKRHAQRFAGPLLDLEELKSAPPDRQKRDSPSVRLGSTSAAMSSITAITYIHTSTTTAATTTLTGRYPIPNGTTAGTVEPYHRASAARVAGNYTSVIFILPRELETEASSPSSLAQRHRGGLPPHHERLPVKTNKITHTALTALETSRIEHRHRAPNDEDNAQPV